MRRSAQAKRRRVRPAGPSGGLPADRAAHAVGSVRRAAAVPLPCLALFLLLAVAPAAPAAAQVEIVVQADGTRVVRNVGEGQARSDERVRPSGEVPRRPVPAAPVWRPAPSPELARAVEHHAGLHGLDPRLVEAVIQSESAWNGRAVSRAGAVGLMQLMPATAVMLAVEDPWDEVENLRGGTAYLAQMMDRFAELELALAAYNAGPSAVERYGGIPPYRETREYVRRVLSLYHGRVVAQAELEPYYGDSRGDSRGSAGSRSGSSGSGGDGPSPRFVRGRDGRLVLTNEPSPRSVRR